MKPQGAPCERIGNGGLNKDVSNMAEMMMMSLMIRIPLLFIDKGV